MPHTKEQRSAQPLCGATKKNGEKCRLFAGQGTEHKGIGRCKLHGGATKTHQKHALDQEVKQRMVARSARPEEVEPHLVLLEELAMSAGHVGFLREEIAALEPTEIGFERAKVLLERYDLERDRLTRIAKACSEAGVDEARIRIEEVRAAQMVQTITAAAKDAGIPAPYVKALGPALRKQVALLAGDEEVAAEAESRVAEIREQVAAAEQERVERAAQRYSGLTFPPAELLPPAEEPTPG